MTTPYEATLKVPQPGEAAPKFMAPSWPAGTISLDDFIGHKNVILAFYPKDMTPGCTKEMCNFSCDLAHFSNVDTQVIGISCDRIKSHEEFTKQFDLKIPLIADEDAAICKSYGVTREGALLANRVTFIIDKQGIVQEVIEGMPNNAELLSLIQQLK